jgi:hypothetical protein
LIENKKKYLSTPNSIIHLYLDIGSDLANLALKESQMHFEKILIEEVNAKLADKSQSLPKDFIFTNRPDFKKLSEVNISDVKLDLLENSFHEKYSLAFKDDSQSIETLENQINRKLKYDNDFSAEEKKDLIVQNKNGYYDFNFRNNFFYCDALMGKIKLTVNIRTVVDNPVVVDININKDQLLNISDYIKENKRLYEVSRNEESLFKIRLTTTRVLENALNKVKSSDLVNPLSALVNHSDFTVISNYLFKEWPNSGQVNLRQYPDTADQILSQLENKSPERNYIKLNSSITNFEVKSDVN